MKIDMERNKIVYETEVKIWYTSFVGEKILSMGRLVIEMCGLVKMYLTTSCPVVSLVTNLIPDLTCSPALS